MASPNLSQPRQPKRTKSRVFDDKTGLRYALNLLKSRPRTTFEVMSRLRDKGWPDIVANSVVGQLSELGILDDERFARDWARYRDRLRPSGDWLLERELSDKGLDERLVKKILDLRQTPEWFEEIGLVWDGRSIEQVLCEQVARRRSRRLVDIEPQKRQQRVMQLLARRGFRPGVIFSTLKLPEES